MKKSRKKTPVTDTQQSVKTQKRDKNGRFVKGNTTAKDAGVDFGSRPENRNPGGWKPENCLSYQYHRFLAMSPAERRAWLIYSQTEKGEGDRKNVSSAAEIAYNQVMDALIPIKGLPAAKEIADRTEGKPKQALEVESTSPQYDETLVLLRQIAAKDHDQIKRHLKRKLSKKPVQN